MRIQILNAVFLIVSSLSAQTPEELVETKLPKILQQAKDLAALPLIVSSVESQNNKPDPQYAQMTQQMWQSLSVRSDLVKGLTQNAAAKILKDKAPSYVSEAFVSDLKGTKVAFLTKPTHWSHSGLPKHELPLQGKIWRGDIELDESTGVNQFQIAVPILKGSKSIGSLVLGIALSELE